MSEADTAKKASESSTGVSRWCMVVGKRGNDNEGKQRSYRKRLGCKRENDVRGK